MKSFFLVIVTSVLLAACNDGSQLKQIEAKLDQRITELEAANKSLSDEIRDLRWEVKLGEFDKYAFLKPGDAGYSALRHDLGIVTVEISDVKPYANGSKVKLKFGNLTSARIDGLKATLDWGKLEKGMPENDKAKSREVTFSASLAPGAWTVTEVVLEGVPPTELGFVRLKDVSHRGIGLKN